MIYTNFKKGLFDMDKDNDILVISEKSQKAYLPYKYDEVNKIYNENINDYNSVKDVINKLYVLPLNKFKHPLISRFREAYNLVIFKEKKSFFKAVNLSFELMFKFDLDPIIIAACRNLDELDIYLDCLEEKQKFNFKCFEIRYEFI